jgi:hypothetical protein
MWDEYLLFFNSRIWDILEEAEKLMKDFLAEQKARIALNNHYAQVKYAQKFQKRNMPQYRAIHIYYPIRATKCNKVGFEQRCRRTTEKKFGKKLA